MALTPYETQVYSGAINATVTPLGQGVIVHSQRCLILNVHISAVNIAGTLDLSLIGRDAYGNFPAIPGASLPQITGTGDYVLYVGPGLTAIPNRTVPVLLPAVVQVAAVLGGGGDFTGQVGMTLID